MNGTGLPETTVKICLALIKLQYGMAEASKDPEDNTPSIQKRAPVNNRPNLSSNYSNAPFVKPRQTLSPPMAKRFVPSIL